MKLHSKYLFRDAFICVLLTIVFLWVVSFIVLNLSIFNPFTSAFKDFSFLDIYYKEKMEIKNPTKDIVIINIEKRNRFEIHQLINHIKKGEPNTIGIDVIFKNQKDIFIDSLLANNLDKKNIFLSKAYINNNWVTNTNVFNKDYNSVGYTNLNFDRSNNVIRKFEGKKTINDSVHYSLSVLIAKYFLGANWDNSIEEQLSNPLTIDYHGNIDSFLNLSYNECMELKKLSLFKNKIILIGYLGTPHGNTKDIEDKLYTPLNHRIAGKSPPDMFGVVLHANLIQMLIKNSFFKVVPKWLTVIIALIITYFSVAFFIVYNTKYQASFAFIKKIVQLITTILLLWLSLLFFKYKILFKPELIIVFLIVGIELIGTYKIIAKKLNTKYKWKSYFFH